MRGLLISSIAVVGLSCGGEEPVVVVFVERPADTGDATVRDGDDEAGILLESVTWSIDWDTEGLTLLDGGGWRMERADGVALELDEGWLVVYTLVLEPCEASAARTPPPHGYAEHPSRTPEAVALPLHALAPVALGTTSFDPGRFCETGVTIFRGEAGDPGMPADGTMEGLSFWMTGAVRPGMDAEWEPFAMQSHLSAEHDLPLVGLAEGAATVEVVLSPAHLLDDLSLELESDRLALGAMSNLAATATATISNGARP